MDPEISLSFDRAVDYYDRTRGLRPETTAKLVALLRAEIGDLQPCLEVGVGTGRMSLPLSSAGVAMAGVDLSMHMMRALVDKAGGTPPFPLVAGDATALPFGDASFGSALAAHVLHLIPNWRDAVAELARVVRRPGLVLVDPGKVTGPGEKFGEVFAAASGTPTRHRGLNEDEDLDAALAEHGAEPAVLGDIAETRSTTYRESIRRLEEGLYSITWGAGEDGRRAGAEAARHWVLDNVGSLDESYDYEVLDRVRAYRLT